MIFGLTTENLIAIAIIGALLLMFIAKYVYEKWRAGKIEKENNKITAPPAPEREPEQQYQQQYTTRFQTQRQPESLFSNAINGFSINRNMHDRMEVLKSISVNMGIEQKEIISSSDAILENIGPYIQKLRNMEKDMRQHALQFDEQFAVLQYQLETLVTIDSYYKKNQKARDSIPKEMAEDRQKQENSVGEMRAAMEKEKMINPSNKG